MDVGDLDPKESRGALKNYLVGRWKRPPNSTPMAKEMESWAKAVWRLKGGILVAFLNNELMLFELDSQEEASRALEKGSRIFKGGAMELERCSLESGYVKSKNYANEAWVRIVGLPLHLWTREILKKIGEGCGGFIAMDKKTTLRTKFSWARILVCQER